MVDEVRGLVCRPRASHTDAAPMRMGMSLMYTPLSGALVKGCYVQLFDVKFTKGVIRRGSCAIGGEKGEPD